MILGLGTDLVYISRIAKARTRFGERFLNRLLSEEERVEYERRGQAIDFLAKRFAAKEAVSKALGVGIGAAARWREIEVLNDTMGKPVLTLYGAAADTARTLQMKKAHIALSDERDIAQAFVVLEG